MCDDDTRRKNSSGLQRHARSRPGGGVDINTICSMLNYGQPLWGPGGKYATAEAYHASAEYQAFKATAERNNGRIGLADFQSVLAERGNETMRGFFVDMGKEGVESIRNGHYHVADAPGYLNYTVLEMTDKQKSYDNEINNGKAQADLARFINDNLSTITWLGEGNSIVSRGTPGARPAIGNTQFSQKGYEDIRTLMGRLDGNVDGKRDGMVSVDELEKAGVSREIAQAFISRFDTDRFVSNTAVSKKDGKLNITELAHGIRDEVREASQITVTDARNKLQSLMKP